MYCYAAVQTSKQNVEKLVLNQTVNQIPQKRGVHDLLDTAEVYLKTGIDQK